MAALRSIKSARLRASTLIETMIASVIFLCVFTISLDTVSRLTLKNNDQSILVEVDYRIKQCRQEFSAKTHRQGSYIREYSWGKIIVNLKPYRNYMDLTELTITADVKNNSKRFKYKYVIEPEHDM